MQVKTSRVRNRKVWTIDNGTVALTMTAGGGNIASVVHRDKPKVNPLWAPVWKTIEPWQYRAKQASRYGSRLLAAICGHNPCLGYFGDPSPDEQKAGLTTHGEAPVARWELLKKRVGKASVSMTCGCTLPVAQMDYRRTVTARKGSNVVTVREQVRNLSNRDLPFTMCQHVTVGPPFLEKGVTVFDMPATKCHTLQKKFSPSQRLKIDTAFLWPDGPGVNGKTVDMRMIGKQYRVSGDFTANLIDTRREEAWFSAVNPRQGLLLAYVWNRKDYPWVGNWEENYSRKEKPWAGKSLTRGMEFNNTPFPIGLRGAVDLGAFKGQRTYRWLPARGRVDVEYSILVQPVDAACKGVREIRRKGSAFEVELR